MDASEILLRIRVVLGLTRAGLARSAQVSPSTIGRIEKGTLDPTWGTLCQILESTSHRLQGRGLGILHDPSAAVAAAFEIDRVLAPHEGVAPPIELPEPAQLWLERWRRIGWIADPFSGVGQLMMAQAAAQIAGPVGHGAASLSVSHSSRWREIALRLDELGIDYAVSNLAVALELPGLSLQAQPVIYVHDLMTAAALLDEAESSRDDGVRLVEANGLELEGVIDGFALRITSFGQAVMDGFRSPEPRPFEAYSALSWMSLAASEDGQI